MAQPVTADGEPSHVDEAYRVQAAAAMVQLAADLAVDPHTEGLSLPSCFGIMPSVGGGMVVRYGASRHDASGSIDGRTEALGQIKGEAWDPARPDTVLPHARRELVRHAHVAFRMAVQDMLPIDLPTWAVLVHPVVLAILLSHEPDRRIMPQTMRYLCAKGMEDRRWPVDRDGHPSHDGRCGTATGDVRVEQGVMVVTRMGVLAPVRHSRDIACLSLVSHPTETSLAMPCALPESVIETIVGRRIGDVVSLPTSGSDEVDAAAADVRIAAVEPTGGGLRFTFEDAVHLPYGDDFPDDATRRTMRLGPVRR